MDPNKNLPSLDPKLKEAYERVMATSLPTNQTPANTPPSAPAPTAQPEPASTNPTPAAPAAPLTPAAHVASPTPEEPAPHVMTPQPMPMATTTTATGPKPVSGGSTFVANTAPTSSGKSKISPIILITAGAIFFVVYTLFWLRFFNVALPFLP